MSNTVSHTLPHWPTTLEKWRLLGLQERFRSALKQGSPVVKPRLIRQNIARLLTKKHQESAQKGSTMRSDKGLK